MPCIRTAAIVLGTAYVCIVCVTVDHSAQVDLHTAL